MYTKKELSRYAYLYKVVIMIEERNLFKILQQYYFRFLTRHEWHQFHANGRRILSLTIFVIILYQINFALLYFLSYLLSTFTDCMV